MKTSIFTMLFIFAAASVADAQFQMGAQVSNLQGHGRHDNHTSLVGTVVYVNYSMTNDMEIGAIVHAYAPKRSKYTSGTHSYFATDAVTNVSGSYIIYVGEKHSTVLPYVGADVGMSTSNHDVEYTNEVNQTSKYKIKETYMMFSPKVGVKMGLGTSMGLFTQFQYNYSPGDGGPMKINVGNPKNSYAITTEPISKYYNIDAGVYINLGK